MTTSTTLAFELTLLDGYAQAVEKVTGALQAEGFGVLTRIDVDKTLKEKLGVDFRPYVIIGACNPPLAHKALTHRADVGLMLPCNVTVEADPAGPGCRVRIADPALMLSVGDFDRDPVLRDVAAEARTRLARVAEALRST